MKIALQICSTHEWNSMIEILRIRAEMLRLQPFGQYFEQPFNGHEGIFYQSGDTKTRSAAACQFAIDRWQPDRIINLGTCGGVGKEIGKLDLIMAEKTVQYDCIIRFGEPQELFYKPMMTTIDTSWVDTGGVGVNPVRKSHKRAAVLSNGVKLHKGTHCHCGPGPQCGMEGKTSEGRCPDPGCGLGIRGHCKGVRVKQGKMSHPERSD